MKDNSKNVAAQTQQQVLGIQGQMQSQQQQPSVQQSQQVYAFILILLERFCVCWSSCEALTSFFGSITINSPVWFASHLKLQANRDQYRILFLIGSSRNTQHQK